MDIAAPDFKKDVMIIHPVQHEQQKKKKEMRERQRKKEAFAEKKGPFKALRARPNV